MTWAWLWDRTAPKPSREEQVKGLRWVIEAHFKRHPPTLPANKNVVEERLKAAVFGRRLLVDHPSNITRRALRVLHPEPLNHLLHVNTVEGDEGTRARTQAAKPAYQENVAGATAELERWRSVAERMRALATVVHDAGVHPFDCHGVQGLPSGASMYPRSLSFSFTMGDMIAEVHACWLLKTWADEADKRAADAQVEIERWNEHLARTSKDETPIIADRLAVLVAVLEAGGERWEFADVADLIRASGTDWTTPPSPLAELYDYEWKSETSRDHPERRALAKWIGKQIAKTTG